MKLEEAPRTLHTSDNFESSDFTIAANPMAFRILFSNIYSDKITAIIRELSTNAYDSHVAANKQTTPFKVHLPNSFEPYFSITDYGVGMSDDFVTTKYNKFFLSDKTQNNDQTGCMGLGSKSPFAYTDSFTVVSRYNGVETTYNAIISDKSLPTIAKVASRPSTECNGVEVRFPVKSQDIWNFQSSAKETLSWFKTLPQVVGCSGFQFNKPDYILKTDKYGVSSGKRYNESRVIMGNVAYKINSRDVQTDYNGQQLLDWGVDIFVGIGDVQVTSSRETLSYDPTTKRNLQSIINIILKDLAKDAERQVASCKTLWEAKCWILKYKATSLGSMLGTANIKWNGKEVNSTLESNANIKIESIDKYGARFTIRERKNVNCDEVKKYINDVPQGGIVRFKTDMDARGIRHAYIITPLDANSQAFKDYIIENDLGLVCTYTSSLPKTKRISTINGTKATVNKLKDNLNWRVKNCWEPAQIDLKDGGIYIEINRFYAVKDGKKIHPEHLEKQIETLRALGYKDPIYGIRKADFNKLKKFKWILYQDYLKKALDDNQTLNDSASLIIKNTELRNNGPFFDLTCKLPKDGSITMLVEKIKEAKKIEKDKKILSYIELCKLMDVKFSDEDELVKLKERVYTEYPLFNFIDSYCVNSDFKTFNNAIEKYINK